MARPDLADKALDYTLAVGALAVLGISLYFTPGTLPGFEVCSFKRMTGLPCPGCGLTRAFCSISHGQIGQAWSFNPFAFLFYALAVYFVLRPWVKKHYPQAEVRFVKSRWSTIMPLALLGGMLVFGVLRMILSPHSA